MALAVSNRAATRWTVRIIPIFIAGLFGVVTYCVVGRLCIDYLYQQRRKTGPAIALLVLYFLFLSLTFASYLRTIIAVQRNPSFVPLPASRDDAGEKGHEKRHHGKRDVEAQVPVWVPPDSNPDSPGLENFYSREVFVCELDGRPKWCSECRHWKPDRAHHSSELGRCVRKMDHMCPWVGGMVSETSFNFFLQFTFYCGSVCAICLGTAAYCLKLEQQEVRPLDGWIIVTLVLSGFFGFFTYAMALTSGRFVLTNITNIDMLRRYQTIVLAVHIPRDTPPSDKYKTITYPLESSSTMPTAGQPNTRASPTTDARSERDLRATRTFAILYTEPLENPWDLGYWENWKSVMGTNPLQWLLPIWQSPCCSRDSMESEYALGPLLPILKERFGIPNVSAVGTGQDIAMHEREPQ